MRNFLRSWPARLVTILLLGQAVLLYSSTHPEAIPPSQPLAQLQRSIGAWESQGDGVIEQEILDTLQADDVLSRFYATAAGEHASLYITAFRSQRNGKNPHSPKNCLPGAGWNPLVEDETSIDVGEAAPIVVNRYIVSHGEDRALVLYWYQSRGRVVASEYKEKFWVIADSMRFNRTDVASVRVMVPILNRDSDVAERTGVAFVKAFYPAIRQILPQ